MPFAVIGMGRLGGAELSYASDIDVLFVYDGDSAGDFDAAEHIATLLVQEIGATTAEGQTFRIDTRLRPEGNQGPLARSLAGYALVLRALRAHVGAPGALEGALRRGLGRGRRAVLPSSSTESCTGGRSPRTTRVRSGA